MTGQGVGDAGAYSKGAENQKLGSVDHLIGVRVVAAGQVTCSSNVATVTFPKVLTGSYTNYAVLLTSVNSGTAATTNVHITTLTDTSSNFASFAIRSEAASDVVHWIVVKIN